MLRILVTGTRHYSDAEHLESVLNEVADYSGIDVVIDGAACGADELASQWARENDIRNERYPASWKQYDRAADLIRNKQMLVEGKPDLVVAFPEDGGRGTQNMMRRAIKAGVPVLDATGYGGVAGAVSLAQWQAPNPIRLRKLISEHDGILRTDEFYRDSAKGLMLTVTWQTRGDVIVEEYGPYSSVPDADRAMQPARVPRDY